MLIRKANAIWNGTLKDGNGRMRLGSGAWEGQYSFGSRFENGVGTNPEELIGAAHAGCFSMALAGKLVEAGHPSEVIRTAAEVGLEPMRGGYRIKSIRLVTTAVVPGIDAVRFRECAEDAKKNCPVSKALGGGVDIELDATLVESSADK
jgi:osmotically inducible protein OsmC